MHRKVTFVLLFAFSIIAIQAQPPTVDKIELSRTHFNNGVKRGIDEDFEAAIEEFETAIELNPLFAEAFLYKGLAEIEMQSYDQAIKDFTITIELDPAFSDQAHYFRGLARYFKNELELAIDDFTVAIRMSPDFVSFYQRGKANLKLKEFRRALQDFDIALRLKEDFYEANLYRGINLYYLEMYDAAMEDLEIATTYLPRNADAHYYSGLTRIAQNNSNAAEEDLARALELDPGYARAAEAREEVLANTSRPSRRNSQQVSPPARQTVSEQKSEGVSRSTADNQNVESTDIDFADLFSASQSREENPDTSSDAVSITSVSETHAKINEPIEKEEGPGENLSAVTPAPAEPVYNSIEQVQPGIYSKSLERKPMTGFGVQVASYSNTSNLISLADAYSEKYSLPVFFNIANVNGRKLYKLIIGQFSNREEAESFRDRLRTESFPDSFLIVFENI